MKGLNEEFVDFKGPLVIFIEVFTDQAEKKNGCDFFFWGKSDKYNWLER